MEKLRNLEVLLRRYIELPNVLIGRFTLVDERLASLDERLASLGERLVSLDIRLHGLRSENLRGREQLASGFARDLNSLNDI
jgi:hypothetical protein